MKNSRFNTRVLPSLAVALSLLSAIDSAAKGDTTPVAAYKLTPSTQAPECDLTPNLAISVGQTCTFVLCEETGQYMLCGMSPAPSGSEGGDISLVPLGIAHQERCQLLGDCLQFTEQVGDTQVLCSGRLAAVAYSVELPHGRTQHVAGEEFIRAYTSPAGTVLVRSLHVMAVVETTPLKASHFVVGVASADGEFTELASWPVDAESQPTLQNLADAGEPVVVESSGAARLAQDPTTLDDCIAQCELEFREEEARLWGVLQNELAVCNGLGTFDPQTQQHMQVCMVNGAFIFGTVGAVGGFCVLGIPAGTIVANPCTAVGPIGTVGGFCVGLGVGGTAGALTWGAMGTICGTAAGACWGWFFADDVCRNAAWDGYELNLMNAAATVDACRTVRCGG